MMCIDALLRMQSFLELAGSARYTNDHLYMMDLKSNKTSAKNIRKLETAEVASLCVRMCLCVPGDGGLGGFLGGQGGMEDGAVPLCGHHRPWSAVSAGHHLAAFCGQHCQLEGVQLHTSTQTHVDRWPYALKRLHFTSSARQAASINPGRRPGD